MEDFIPIYPSADDKDIQRIITAKKEFNELAPDVNDKIIDGTRRLLNNQELFGRIMTTTDRMLNMYEPGAGKTCAFIRFAEGYKDTGAFQKAIILERSNTLINEVKRQILNNCTPVGEYSSEEGFDDLETTERMRKKRRNDSLKQWYEFNTYDTFSNQLEDLTDDQIAQKYKKYIFIFDEAHNIIPDKDKVNSSKRYKEFKRLCHNVTQCKICLITATPMINGVIESIHMMNLLLPPDNQIPLKSDYRLSELEPYFRGKITFIQTLLENAKVKYMGREFIFSQDILDLHPTNPALDPVNKRKVSVPINMYLTKMGDLQLEQFVTVKKDNFKALDKGFSSFVFPIINGVTSRSTDYIEESGGKIKWKNFSNFIDWEHRGNYISFQDWLKDINNVKRVSGKMADIIKTELESPGCSFIFHTLVDNAGVKFMMMVLGLYGFEQFTENSFEYIFTNASKTKIRDSYKKHPRVALITGGLYGTDSRQDAIINLFNSDANVNGEYIKILIGSGKARDGINVYHCQRMHLFSPHWHYSGMIQSINRVLRVAGHNALKAYRKREALALGYVEGSPEYIAHTDIEVKVYRHCIDYNLDENIREIKNDNSDYYFMKLAVEKQIDITRRMNMMKACAVDALINRPRNKLSLDDPFNFDKLLYIPTWTEIVDPSYIPYKSDPVDYSTYNILYINPEKIVSKIKRILLKNGNMSYDEIKQEFRSSTKEDIYAAIESFRSQGKYVENEFGEKLTLEVGENGLHLQRFSYPSDPRFIHNISIYDFPQAVVVPRNIASFFQQNVHLMMRSTYLQLIANSSELATKDSVYDMKLNYIKDLNRWKQIQILEELIKAKYNGSKILEDLSKFQIDVFISMYRGYLFDFTGESSMPPAWVHVMTTTFEKEKSNVQSKHKDPKRLKIFVLSEKYIGWRLPFEEESNFYHKMIKAKIEKDMSKYVKFSTFGSILQDGKFRIHDDGSYDKDILTPMDCPKGDCGADDESVTTRDSETEGESDDNDEDEAPVTKEDRRMNQRGKEPKSINKKILIKIAVAEKMYPPWKKSAKATDENIKYKREAIRAEHSDKYVSSLTDEEVNLYYLWDSCSNVAKFFQSEIIKKMRDDGRLYEPYILTY